MQMVQNGVHKCTKKPPVQISEMETISEVNIANPNVLHDFLR